jgi:hypothetical protein
MEENPGMGATENLSVVYHQQDTDYYCGAACAQMVLDQIGAGLLAQDDLYSENHSHSTIEPDWATGPDGLLYTMNDRRPAAFHKLFILYGLAHEDSISRKICWTIHKHQVAPIALVYGSQHWIVIRGYDATAAPSDFNDATYTITAFEVNNPWPPTPALGPPPPHGLTDACGTGGNRGLANDHISYAFWKSTYMTGVPDGHWKGQFVAVCGGGDPPTVPHQSLPTTRRFNGDQIVTANRAGEVALELLDELKLAERKEWRNALTNVQQQTPLLVQRLDHLDSVYYIVPLGRTGGQSTAAVALDGRYGNYLQSVALPDGGIWTARVDAAGAQKLVANHRFELENFGGSVMFRPDLMGDSQSLVWKPCLESLSPFFPFYRFTSGAATAYVRIDGVVFTSLHDSYRGL